MIKTYNGKDFKQELINDYKYYIDLFKASDKNKDVYKETYEREAMLISYYYRELYNEDIKASIN